MRKREVIELRYRIDCMGWSSASKGHQQETGVKRKTVDTYRSPRAWHT